LAKAFIGKEEKCSIPPSVKMGDQDGAAAGYAKLVLAKWIADWQKKVTGVELLVTQELPCRAMQRICLGSRQHIDNAAGHAPEFRKIIVGLDLEFLDVINNWRIVVFPRNARSLAPSTRNMLLLFL
jgi:hypothetical protein